MEKTNTLELINNVIAFAKAEAITHDEFGGLEMELEKTKRKLLDYITTLEAENAHRRERLAGFDPKEVMPPEGVDVLAFTQDDDYQLLNWNGVCYCEAYGSDNFTEPAGFYDEEIIRWWRLPDRPQSGGEQGCRDELQ